MEIRAAASESYSPCRRPGSAFSRCPGPWFLQRPCGGDRNLAGVTGAQLKPADANLVRNRHHSRAFRCGSRNMTRLCRRGGRTHPALLEDLPKRKWKAATRGLCGDRRCFSAAKRDSISRAGWRPRPAAVANGRVASGVHCVRKSPRSHRAPPDDGGRRRDFEELHEHRIPGLVNPWLKARILRGVRPYHRQGHNAAGSGDARRGEWRKSANFSHVGEELDLEGWRGVRFRRLRGR